MKAVDTAHIITRLDRGGSAQNTLRCALGQARAGRRVALVSGLGRESEMTPQESAALKRDLEDAKKSGVMLFTEPNLVRRISPPRDLAALFGLIRLLRRLKPRIVHTHTSKGGVLGRVAALFVAPRPLIVHTPHGHIFHGYFGRGMTSVFIHMERLLARFTDALIALTPKERADHLALKIGVAERFHVVPSGVDLAAFVRPERPAEEIRRGLGIAPDASVAVIVGRMVPVKAQHFFLEAGALALERVQNLRLVVVGDGPLRGELAERARRLGIRERVVFTGFRNDVADILHACDLFVLTSLNEGMGRVLAEAMAAALPVAAFGVGGVVDVVTEETGVLVEPFDVKRLSGVMAGLLNDPEKRERLAAAGTRRAEEYTEESMLALLDQVYSKALRGRG